MTNTAIRFGPAKCCCCKCTLYQKADGTESAPEEITLRWPDAAVDLRYSTNPGSLDVSIWSSSPAGEYWVHPCGLAQSLSTYGILSHVLVRDANVDPDATIVYYGPKHPDSDDTPEPLTAADLAHWQDLVQSGRVDDSYQICCTRHYSNYEAPLTSFVQRQICNDAYSDPHFGRTDLRPENRAACNTWIDLFFYQFRSGDVTCFMRMGWGGNGAITKAYEGALSSWTGWLTDPWNFGSFSLGTFGTAPNRYARFNHNQAMTAVDNGRYHKGCNPGNLGSYREWVRP